MKWISLAKDYYRNFMSNELSNRFINLLSVDLLIKVSGLALMYVYLKVMSPEEYGIYGIIINLIGSVSLFMNLGLYIAQTTFFNDYKENLGKLIFNINLVLIFFLVILYILFYYTLIDFDLLYYLIGKETKGFSLPRYRMWIWVGITTQIFTMMMSNYFVMSKRKIRILQIFNGSRILITNAFTIWALYHFNIDKAYGRTKYSIIMDAFVALPFFIYYIRLVKFEIDFKLIKRSLMIGLPTMASAIIGSIYGLIDRNILLKKTDGNILGIYTYAYTLSGNLWVFLQAFLNAFWPNFLEEKDPKKSFKHTIRVTRKVMRLLALVSVAMYVFAVTVDASGLISIKYKEALEFMPVMLVTQLVIAFSTIMSNYFIYFKRTYIQIFVGLGALLINWRLCLWLIPEMQTWGAILATLIAASLACVFNFWFAYHNCRTRPVKP